MGTFILEHRYIQSLKGYNLAICFHYHVIIHIEIFANQHCQDEAIYIFEIQKDELKFVLKSHTYKILYSTAASSIYSRVKPLFVPELQPGL